MLHFLTTTAKSERISCNIGSIGRNFDNLKWYSSRIDASICKNTRKHAHTKYEIRDRPSNLLITYFGLY